jgi:aminoglycoside phosphotransferase (APT) family kinase protein
MCVAPAGPWGMMPSVDRTAITSELVSRLVGAQFPRWAGLPVRRVEPGGWDNITFRLGPDMSVRLPSGPGYAEQVEKEHRWLPGFAGQLPLPIPVPLAMGAPGCRLSAVIDFGCSAVGDPACDTVIAWTFLSGEGRRVFQSRLPVDRGTWARGRGWALWKAMIVLVDALREDPADALATKHVIAEVLAGDGLA